MKRMLDKLQVQKARISTVAEDENSITLRFSYSPKSFPILLTIKNCLMLPLIESFYESANLTNNLLKINFNPPINVELYGYGLSGDLEDYVDITFQFESTTSKSDFKKLLNNTVDVLTYSLDIGYIEA